MYSETARNGFNHPYNELPIVCLIHLINASVSRSFLFLFGRNTSKSSGNACVVFKWVLIDALSPFV